MPTSPARGCPTCGEPIQWTGDAQVVECRFCHCHIDTAAWTTTQQGADRKSATPRSRVLAVVAGVSGALVALAVVAALALTGALSSPPAVGETPTSASSPARAATGAPTATAGPTATGAAAATAEPGDATELVQVVLEFGKPGMAPGQLNDPRQITVAPSGDIFVADYRTLRVQRFDETGTYVGQLKLKAGTQSEFINGLAADHTGHLWVARGGDLLRYHVVTGKLVSARLHKAPKLSYGSVAVDPHNNVLVQNFGSASATSRAAASRADNLRKLTVTGRLLKRWQRVANGPVAVDAQGGVFVADQADQRIDVIDQHGALRASIGGRGRPGWDIGFIQSLAVDGAGHLFVLGADVLVLDAAGQELLRFDDQGARALATDTKGFLYAATVHSRVIKWRVHLAGR